MTLPTKRQAIIDAMPGTISQLMAKAGASQPVVQKWVTRWRAKEFGTGEHVHVSRWKRTNGRHAAVYAVGDLPDVPRPARLTESQYNKRRYKRIKKFKNEARTIRREALRNAKELAKVPQTWASALLGMAA